MKANWHKIIEHCVEVGVEGGWNRAHKHQANPDPEYIKQQIEQYIWNELYEWVDFLDLKGNPL